MAGSPLPAHQGTAAAASSTSTTAASSSGSAECGTPSVLRSSTAAKIKGQGGRAGEVLKMPSSGRGGQARHPGCR